MGILYNPFYLRSALLYGPNHFEECTPKWSDPLWSDPDVVSAIDSCFLYMLGGSDKNLNYEFKIKFCFDVHGIDRAMLFYVLNIENR